MTETQASCPRAALLAARAVLDDKLNSAESSVGGLSEMPAQLVASSGRTVRFVSSRKPVVLLNGAWLPKTWRPRPVLKSMC